MSLSIELIIHEGKHKMAIAQSLFKGFRHNFSEGHVTNINQGYLKEALLALHGDLGVFQNACQPKATAPPTVVLKFRAALGIALREL